MKIALIAAVTENDVIGRDGAMPWHLPADLAFFKQTTVRHSIVMGRRTFESFGSTPLSQRQNIIITRNPDYHPDGVDVVHSLAAALSAATAPEPVFICGGASIYAEALPLAERLYITRIHAHLDGDTFFPAIDWGHWKLIEQREHAADRRNAYTLHFRTYERLIPAASV